MVIFKKYLHYSCFYSLVLILASLANLPLGQESQAANIFETLFGKQRPSNTQRQKMLQQQMLQKHRSAPIKQKAVIEKASLPAKASKAAVPTAAKSSNIDENSAKIVVFGDNFAQAVADGLNRYYQNNPTYHISKYNRKDFSLLNVRNDILKEVEDVLIAQDPELIIFAFGSNAYKYINHDVDRALAFYQSHLENLSEYLQEKHRNWMFIGLPPAPDAKQNDFRQNLNQLLAITAKRYDKIYIPIWRAFSDNEGNFVETLPQTTETPEQIRLPNGTFTPLGQDKLALIIHDRLELSVSKPQAPPFQKTTLDNAFHPVSKKEQQYISPTPVYQLDGISYKLLGNDKSSALPKKIITQPTDNKPFGRADNFLLTPKPTNSP